MPRTDNVLDPDDDGQYSGSRIAATIGGFAVLSLLIFIMERMGVDARAISGLTTAGLVMVIIFLALRFVSLEPRHCFVSGRLEGAVQLGLVAAHDVIGVLLVVFLLASTGNTQLAFISAMVAGMFASGALLVPYIRKSGAFSAADFLANRFDSKLLRLLVLVAVVVAGFGLLLSALEVAVSLFSDVLSISAEPVRRAILILSALAALTAGMKSLNWISATTVIILICALAYPAIFLTLVEGGLTGILGEAVNAAPVAGEASAISLAGVFSPTIDPGSGTATIALVFLLALGLPLLTFRHASAQKVGYARKSTSTSLLVVAFALAFSLPHLISGSQKLIYGTDLPAALQIVGVVALGMLMISTVATLMWSIAVPLAHDGFKQLLMPKIPPAQTLFLARLSLIALAVAADKLSGSLDISPLDLSLVSAAILSTCLTLPVLATIWWSRFNKIAAMGSALFAIPAISALIYFSWFAEGGFTALPVEFVEIIERWGIAGSMVLIIAGAVVLSVLLAFSSRAPDQSQLDWQHNVRHPGGRILIRQNW